jgi:Ca2+-binding EF-hand superfamily protein
MDLAVSVACTTVKLKRPINSLSKKGPAAINKKLDLVFDHVDQDGSGAVSRNELKAAVKLMPAAQRKKLGNIDQLLDKMNSDPNVSAKKAPRPIAAAAEPAAAAAAAALTDTGAKLDGNGDGKVDAKELSRAGAGNVAALMDADGDGKIDAAELAQATGMSEAEAAAVIADADVDGDGSLDLAELDGDDAIDIQEWKDNMPFEMKEALVEAFAGLFEEAGMSPQLLRDKMGAIAGHSTLAKYFRTEKQQSDLSALFRLKTFSKSKVLTNRTFGHNVDTVMLLVGGSVRVQLPPPPPDAAAARKNPYGGGISEKNLPPAEGGGSPGKWAPPKPEKPKRGVADHPSLAVVNRVEDPTWGSVVSSLAVSQIFGTGTALTHEAVRWHYVASAGTRVLYMPRDIFKDRIQGRSVECYDALRMQTKDMLKWWHYRTNQQLDGLLQAGLPTGSIEDVIGARTRTVQEQGPAALLDPVGRAHEILGLNRDGSKRHRHGARGDSGGGGYDLFGDMGPYEEEVNLAYAKDRVEQRLKELRDPVGERDAMELARKLKAHERHRIAAGNGTIEKNMGESYFPERNAKALAEELTPAGRKAAREAQAAAREQGQAAAEGRCMRARKAAVDRKMHVSEGARVARFEAKRQRAERQRLCLRTVLLGYGTRVLKRAFSKEGIRRRCQERAKQLFQRIQANNATVARCIHTWQTRRAVRLERTASARAVEWYVTGFRSMRHNAAAFQHAMRGYARRVRLVQACWRHCRAVRAARLEALERRWRKVSHRFWTLASAPKGSKQARETACKLLLAEENSLYHRGGDAVPKMDERERAKALGSLMLYHTSQKSVRLRVLAAALAKVEKAFAADYWDFRQQLWPTLVEAVAADYGRSKAKAIAQRIKAQVRAARKSKRAGVGRPLVSVRDG